MIKLITGQPGAGKSLALVDEACVLRERAEKTGDYRPIYACGIDGLRADVATVLDDLADWQACPDGSIVLVDEAWRWFPTRGPSKQPPAWLTALAEHRHRGFDFVVATQHPTQIDIFVRHLVGQHVHLARKFGTHNVQRTTWESAQTDVKSVTSRKLGSTSAWRFPRKRFGLYDSATQHNVKRRVPKRVYFAVAGLLLLPVLGWAAYHFLSRLAHPQAPSVAVAQPVSPAAVQGGAVLPAHAPETAAQWINAQLPRIVGVPWSAPIFDGQQVATRPDLLCVITETSDRQATTCHCYTEQVTPLPDVPDKVCRQAAEHGVYNPYRVAMDDGASRAAPRAAPEAPRVRPLASDVHAGAPGLSAPPRAPGADLSSVYVPPEWSPAPSSYSASAASRQ